MYGNCKTAGHPTDECPHPKKDYPPTERDWKKGKRVRIQDPEDEEEGARNVNHIQHVATSSSRARKVNAVTTRSKGPPEPYPIIDENSSEPSAEELRDNIRGNDPRNKLIIEPNAIPRSDAIPMTLPSIELPQPVPISFPTPPAPAKPYTILERTPSLTIPQVRPTEVKSKPTPYQIPHVRNLKSRSSLKPPRTMELARGLQQYDIMQDLDNIHLHITMRQLLAVAPQCRTTLGSAMIRKRAKVVEVNDVTLSQDPGAPAVDVIIDGVLVAGFQVDIGSSVNLMSVETMEELGLTNMVPTSIILKMADHTRTKPLGQLPQVPVHIAGQEYKIDFVVFRTTDAIQPIPGILGRPWLITAEAKEDWGKGTLTLGKGKDKTILPLFLTQYQGETQDEGTEFTTDGYETESDENPIQSIHNVGNHQRAYNPIGMGEYFISMKDDDSDNAILSWQNSCPVNNVTTTTEPQPPGKHALTPNPKKRPTPLKPLEGKLPSFEEDWEDAMFSYNTPIKSYVSKDIYKEMNLGTEEVPKIIKVYEKLSKTEWQYWYNFFKRNIKVFAWTYKDLRGVPPEVCEHKIVLEEGTTPVRQRQYRMNPKYSLMVKEEIDKLLEA